MSFETEHQYGLQDYLHRAHELRSQYIAQLMHLGFAALAGVMHRPIQVFGRWISKVRNIVAGHRLRNTAN
ncbi:MAG: hypothetical protein ACREUY_07625 [Burkholderiales bacterium]